MERTSTKHTPWYLIPSNHKWFRNLAISAIIADTLEETGLKTPPTRVDIAKIRRKYHTATTQQSRRRPKAPKAQEVSTFKAATMERNYQAAHLERTEKTRTNGYWPSAASTKSDRDERRS
jgi:polyphosphate kinase 2 PPK2